MIWGDTVHVPEVQTAFPEAGMAFDTDLAAAAAARKRMFDRVSADGILIAGMHLHFPAFSRLARRGDAYALFPEACSRSTLARISALLRRSRLGQPANAPAPDVRALLVGVMYGKTLGWSLGCPVLGVNHLEGHLFSPFLRAPGDPAAPARERRAAGHSRGLRHRCRQGARGGEGLELPVRARLRRADRQQRVLPQGARAPALRSASRLTRAIATGSSAATSRSYSEKSPT